MKRNIILIITIGILFQNSYSRFLGNMFKSKRSTELLKDSGYTNISNAISPRSLEKNRKAIARNANRTTIAQLAAGSAAIGASVYGINNARDNYNRSNNNNPDNYSNYYFNDFDTEETPNPMKQLKYEEDQRLAAEKKANSGLWNRTYQWASNLNPYWKAGLAAIGITGVGYGAWKMFRKQKNRVTSINQVKKTSNNEQVQ